MKSEHNSQPVSIEKYYSKHYAKTADAKDLLDPRLKLVLDLFWKQRPLRLLDIGCGDGKFASLLNQITNAKVIGIDVSETAVTLANKNIEAYRVEVGNGIFPFNEGYFDGIFCGDVIEHVFDTDHLLDEIGKVMSEDGFCILTTPNLAAWHNRISLALGYQPFYTEVSIYHNVGKLSLAGGATSMGHIRGFTYRSLKELLIKHNFKIINAFGVYEYHIPPPLNLIDKIASYFPSISSFIVVMFKKANRKKLDNI